MPLAHRIARLIRPVTSLAARRRRNRKDRRLGMACELLEGRTLLSAVNSPIMETGAYGTSQILVRFDEEAIAGGVADAVLAGTKLRGFVFSCRRSF